MRKAQHRRTETVLMLRSRPQAGVSKHAVHGHGHHAGLLSMRKVQHRRTETVLMLRSRPQAGVSKHAVHGHGHHAASSA
jgi:hypothetical protein